MEPQYITWKKYGYRHIIREGTVRSGISLCGCWWDAIHYRVATYPQFGKGWDVTDKRRPLCGNCKKIWERQNENSA